MAPDPFPRERVTATLRRMPAYLKLAWRLARDPLLGRARRAALVAAAGYLASPIDLVPGVIPVAGQLDDIAVALAAIRFALAGLDPERRRAHLEAVGLADDDLGSDLRTLAATSAWLIRAGARTTGRIAAIGGRLAVRGATAAGRAARTAAPVVKRAAAGALPATGKSVARVGSAARVAAAKAGPAARDAAAQAGPAARDAARSAGPAARRAMASGIGGVARAARRGAPRPATMEGPDERLDVEPDVIEPRTTDEPPRDA